MAVHTSLPQYHRWSFLIFYNTDHEVFIHNNIILIHDNVTNKGVEAVPFKLIINIKKNIIYI